ncbi:hypothetical protein ACI2OX_03615 [Bacillus sp. N9]
MVHHEKGNVTETTTVDSEPRMLLSPMKRRAVEAAIWIFLLFTSFIPFISMAASSFIKAYGLPFHPENLSLKVITIYSLMTQGHIPQ